MADSFSIGISALLTAQRQLGTTSHNIANVNTQGYSRQRVELVQQPSQGTGGLFLGSGVTVGAVNRLADEFLTSQLSAADSSEAKASAFVAFASRVDSLIGDGTFSNSLDNFFSAIQDVNGNPSSTSGREVLLNTAKSFAARFSGLEQRLTAIANDVNSAIKSGANKVNALADAIADINGDIVRALGSGAGAKPNDLLDQREQLVSQLSNIVGADTIELEDGAINVFIGSGQLVVAGSTSLPLAAIVNPLDPERLEIATTAGGVSSVVSNLIGGGELGAALEFREDVLDPARNSIGRLAAALTIKFNEQHREGLDLDDNFGADMFTIGVPRIHADAGNSGAVAIALDTTAVDALTTADYRLAHNGTDFSLLNLSTGSVQTLSGGGPFNVDGMTITVTTPPASGDVYMLQPTKALARNMAATITNWREVAVARPNRSSAEIGNIGNASISAPSVLDITDANLMVPTQIVFNDPPSNYQINGVGPLIPYATGTDIDVNGWRVQISGVPLQGDVFNVEPNFGGAGDNGNGQLLSALQLTKIIDGATATLQDTYSQFVGLVGSKTQQAEIARDALQVLQNNAEAARDSLSAVNLDEEAADLLRYQQAYSAAAQVISIANDTFDSLLSAVRR